jgi:hypothetical protein
MAVPMLRLCRVRSKARGSHHAQVSRGDFLSVESVLIYQRTLFLHGPAATGKTRLLKRLASFWADTCFVEKIEIRDSREFLQSEYWGIFWGFGRYVRREVTTFTSTPSLAVNLAPSKQRRPQRVYIIDHIDVLYPPRLSALDDHERQMIEAGRKNLVAFLDKIHQEGPLLSACALPYVIVAGRDRESGELLMKANKYLQGGRIQHRLYQ